MKILKRMPWLVLNRVSLAAVVLLVSLAGAGLMAWADRACQQAAQGRVFRSLALVPPCEVGLLLGTSKETRSGQAFFTPIQTRWRLPKLHLPSWLSQRIVFVL
jgi:vancomycin permeability regulator SanA